MEGRVPMKELAMNELVNSVDKLDDFLSFVIVYAPSRFLPRHKMDLEKAFETIREGLGECREVLETTQAFGPIARYVDEAYVAYKSGKAADGAELLRRAALLLS
jgi:hypothetical protein